MRALVESVAWEKSKSSGANMDGGESARRYFEAACVSFCSARRSNPGVELVLVANVDVPEGVGCVLKELGVRVKHQPFDSFSFSRDVPWHLAYYKLCALSSVVGEGRYEQVCMLDTDTWVRGPLDDMFGECRGGVGLYDLHYGLASHGRSLMAGEAGALGIDAGRATCWGGEAICGDSDGVGALLDACFRVKSLMEERGSYSQRGDEFLLFVAGAAGWLPGVSRLNPYVARVWTGRYYTPCCWEEKAVLHLPAEKVYSFPRAFGRLESGSELPEGWFERSCGLRRSKRPFDPAWACSRAVDRIIGR